MKDKKSIVRVADIVGRAQFPGGPEVSRRGFVALVVSAGTAAFLLRMEGAHLVHAYADESGEMQYVIYIVSKHQVLVSFFDMSNTDGIPLEGAKVTLHSYSKKTDDLVGTTNDHGVFLADISALSRDVSDDQGGKEYRFWGSLLVELDGYRTYETGVLWVAGGDRVVAATQPTQDHMPYFRCVTIGGYDIQYAKDDFATFLQSGEAKTPATHSLKIKLAVPAGAPRSGYTVGVVHGERGADGLVDPLISPRTSYVGQKDNLSPDSNGFINFTLDLIRFAKSKLADPCFMVDQDTDVFYRVGTTTCTMKTTLAIEDGCIPDQYPPDNTSYSSWETSGVELEDSPSDGASATIPIQHRIPVFQDVTISIWHPPFPVKYEYSPAGKALLALGLPTYADVRWDGVPEGQVWKFVPLGETKKIYQERFWKARKNHNERWANADGKNGMGKYTTFGDQEVRVYLGAFAEGEWGKVEELEWTRAKVWGIKAGLILEFLFAYTESIEVELGPVPAFTTFELALAAEMELTANFVAERPALSGWKLNKDFPESGLVFDLLFSGSLTVGVGLVGFITIGVSGSAYVRFLFGLVQPPEGYKFPHLNIGLGAAFAIVFQAFLLKISLSIWHTDAPHAYDNWPAHEVSGTPRPSLREEYKMALPNGEKGYFELENPRTGLYSFQDFAKEMIPVTQEELLKVSEYRGVPQSSAPGEPVSFSYTPFDKHTGDVCLSSTLGETGPFGARTKNVKILSNVFSDPRERVVTLGDNVYLFRTIAVTHGEVGEEHAVTRIGVSRFKSDVWEPVTPIDFAYDSTAHVDRSQIFDYDFDVVTKASKKEIHVLLIGGARPLEAANGIETIDSVSRNMVISYVILDEDIKVKSQHTYFDYFNLDDPDDPHYDPDFDHAVLFPRLATDSYGITVATFLDRRVPKGQSFFDSTTQFTDFPAVMFFDTDSNPIERGRPSRRIFEATTGNSELKSDVQVHMFSPSALTSGVVLSYTTVDSSKVVIDGEADDASTAVFTSLVVATSGVVTTTERGRFNKVTMVRPWDSEGGFVLKQGKDLKSANIDTGDTGNEVIIAVGETILSDFSVDQFDISSNGHMIYFVKVMDGTLPETYGPDGKPIAGDPVEDYQIYATKKIRDSKGVTSLIEPYPFAQLDYLPSHLVSYPTTDATAFLYTNITNFNESTSDIYHAIVPHYKQIKLLDFTAESPYLCPGEEEYLKVKVRNEGNVIVTGFSVTISDGEGFSTEIPIVINQAITFPGIDDIQTDKPLSGVGAYDGGFTPCQTAFDIPTQKGVFLPGKTKMYRMKLDVPKSWFDDAEHGKNEKTLTAFVKAKSIVVADGSVNQDYIELDHVLDNIVSADMFVDNSMDPVTKVITYQAGVLHGPATTVQKNDYVYSSDKDGGKGKAPKSKSPSTGDPFGDYLALLALALGAGGVAASKLHRGNDAGESNVVDETQ